MARPSLSMARMSFRSIAVSWLRCAQISFVVCLFMNALFWFCDFEQRRIHCDHSPFLLTHHPWPLHPFIAGCCWIMSDMHNSFAADRWPYWAQEGPGTKRGAQNNCGMLIIVFFLSSLSSVVWLDGWFFQFFCFLFSVHHLIWFFSLLPHTCVYVPSVTSCLWFSPGSDCGCQWQHLLWRNRPSHDPSHSPRRQSGIHEHCGGTRQSLRLLDCCSGNKVYCRVMAAVSRLLSCLFRFFFFACMSLLSLFLEKYT